MKNWLIIGAIAVAIIAVSVFRSGPSRASVEVELAEVQRGPIMTSVIASGSLAFRTEVKLTSEVIAKVIELNVEEGDRVEEGQILMRLDPEQFEAEVEQHAANVRMQQIAIERQNVYVANLERRWQRQRSMRSAGLSDEESFENIDHELQTARLELDSRQQSLTQANALLDKATKYLDKTVIRAPIAGIVTALDIKVGETVISGTTNIVGSSMMTIANQDDIITEVFVDEADIAGVEVGQEADVYAVAFPDTAMRGVVETIGSTARSYPGRNGLAVKVKIRLIDDQASLLSGMSCRAEIYQAAADDIPLVPIEAVRTNLDSATVENFVFVVENGLAKRVSVGLGPSSDELQGIDSGLEGGETIVVGPFRELQRLEDGDPVEAGIDD